MSKVVNLFAGPGAGKSTGATFLFTVSKMNGLNTEYVSEHAKDEAWQGTINTYYNPIHYLGEQHNRQFRLKGKVDFMVTDSPLLQQAVYVNDDFFEVMCTHLFNEFENLNFFIKRSKAFNPKGRKHNFEQAKEIDDRLINMLQNHGQEYIIVEGNIKGYNQIVNKVFEWIGHDRKKLGTI